MAQARIREQAAKSMEILLVEDNVGDVELTQRILRDSKLALNIDVVPDGEIAMDYLRRKGEYADAPRPDLILLDLNMPKVDGYQLCSLIRKHQRTRDIPVVMLSGKDGVFDRLRGRMVGCTSYIARMEARNRRNE